MASVYRRRTRSSFSQRQWRCWAQCIYGGDCTQPRSRCNSCHGKQLSWAIDNHSHYMYTIIVKLECQYVCIFDEVCGISDITRTMLPRWTISLVIVTCFYCHHIWLQRYYDYLDIINQEYADSYDQCIKVYMQIPLPNIANSILLNDKSTSKSGPQLLWIFSH